MSGSASRADRRVRYLREQLSQDVLQDSTVAVVGGLGRSVDPYGDVEFRRGSARLGADDDLARQRFGCPLAVSPMIEYTSSPVRPRLCADCPGANCSGSTPMSIRLERWIRSNEVASTALTPSSRVPFAAQSRDDPEPYSAPARMISGTSSAAYAGGGVEDAHRLAVGQVAGEPALGARAPAGCAAGCSRRCRESSPRGCRAANRRS